MRKDISVEANQITEVTIVSPQEPSRQVKVKVLDEEGKPLANVAVRVKGKRNTDFTGSYPSLYHDQKLDETGILTFVAPEPGRYNLTIFADGFEPARVEGIVVGDENVASEFFVKLKREKAVEVKGDVEVQALSPRGKPMSKVWVVPVRKQGESYWEWDWQFERGQFTDKEGKTRFIGLPAGDYIFLGLPPSDNLPLAESPTVSIVKPGTFKVRLTFPLTGRIVGKLVDEKGNPIAGELVGIWKDEGELKDFWLSRETDITQSDGSFVFEGVPEGTYTFGSSVGFPQGLATTGQKVFVKGGKTVKVTVCVRTDKPTASIVGEVFDDKGNPVKGATVLVNSEPMLKTFTDENGRFAFNEIPAFRFGERATYSVTVMKRGFAMGLETVKVDEGKKVEVRLSLVPGAVIEGQLVDEKGEPIGGMPAYAVPQELACAG